MSFDNVVGTNGTRTSKLGSQEYVFTREGVVHITRFHCTPVYHIPDEQR